MDLVVELVKQGAFGVVAALFFWLYLQERKEHKETRKEKDVLQEARRLDAVETRTDVTSVLPGISQALQNISDKIEISRSSKRK